MRRESSLRGAWIRVCILGVACLMGVSAAAAQDEQTVDAAQKQLLAAHGLFERTHFNLAADEYTAFLKKYPNHEEATVARYALAICHFRLGRFEEAAGLIEKVMGESRFKQHDEALAVLGHCRLSLGQHEAALAAFDKLLATHGQSKHAAGAMLNRVQLLYTLDKKPESLEAARTFIQRHGDNAHADAAYYFQALAQYDLKQFEPCTQSLAALRSRFPQTKYALDATYLQGQCALELGRFAEAAKQFRAMIEAAPATRLGQARYGLAVALYRAADYEAAAQTLAELLEKHGEDAYAAPARFQLGLTQVALERYGDARRTLENVAKHDAERGAAAKYWLAQCDMREKKFAEARKRLDELFALDPPAANVEQIAFDRAICRMAMKEFTEAAAEFAAYRRRFANSGRAPEAMYREAFCLHQVEKFTESLALCEQVAALSSDQHAAIRAAAAELAAENLFLIGKYEQAAEAFARLEPADESSGDRYTFRRGQSAAFLGDYTRAIELLTPLAARDAVANDDRLRDAIFVLGDAYLQTRQYDDAVRTLNRFVSLVGDKASEEARFKLGLAQLRSGDAGAARGTLERVMNGKTDSPWVQRALFEFGQLAYNDKQAQPAAAALNKLINTKADDALLAPAHYLLAFIAYDAAKYDDAAKKFAHVTRAFPGHELASDALFQQGMSLRLAEQPEAALSQFQAYLRDHANGPRIHEARYHAGACLAKLGKHAEALQMFAPLMNVEAARTDALFYDLAWSQRATDANAAAEQSYRRLLADFPTSKLATAVRTELADLLYQKDAFKEAAALLEKALEDQSADAAIIAAAQYRLGWCYTKLDDHAKAAPLFDTFAQQNAKDDLAPSALYQAGDSFTRTGRYDLAQQQFARLIEQHPKHELAATTLLKLGEVQNQASEYDKAGVTFTRFLNEHGKSEFAYLAQFGLGWSCENRRQYDEARTWYARVIEHHNGQTAARAQFQIGECYFAQGKFEEAARELLKVDIVYDYPAWSSKALYEAGRAFEELKNPEQARVQYSLCATKYKDEPVAKLAQERLNALK